MKALPQEILDNIIYKSKGNNLKSLRLVSRAFNDTATRRLFQYVSLSPAEEEFFWLQELNGSKFRELIQEVIWADRCASLNPRGSRGKFIQLFQLSSPPHSGRDDTKPWYNEYKLRYSSLVFTPIWTPIINILETLPNLRRVHIDNFCESQYFQIPDNTPHAARTRGSAWLLPRPMGANLPHLNEEPSYFDVITRLATLNLEVLTVKSEYLKWHHFLNRENAHPFSNLTVLLVDLCFWPAGFLHDHRLDTLTWHLNWYREARNLKHFRLAAHHHTKVSYQHLGGNQESEYEEEFMGWGHFYVDDWQLLSTSQVRRYQDLPILVLDQDADFPHLETWEIKCVRLDPQETIEFLDRFRKVRSTFYHVRIEGDLEYMMTLLRKYDIGTDTARFIDCYGTDDSLRRIP